MCATFNTCDVCIFAYVCGQQLLLSSVPAQLVQLFLPTTFFMFMVAIIIIKECVSIKKQFFS